MTYNSEQVNLLGVQRVLMPLLISTSVAADWLAASDLIIQNGTLKIVQIHDFLYCGMWKLYYVLPPGYIARSISPWYNTISKKNVGN